MNYTYTKIINSDRLKLEIEASTITVALDNISTSGETLTVNFKASLSTSEVATLDALVAAHTPTPVEYPTLVSLNEKKTSDGIQKVAVYEPEGAASTKATHDFCDKTTWFSTAQLVTGETLATTDDLTFNSAHTHWIDLTHGKVYDENDRVAEDATYIPVIKVDGVEVTSGFTINYATGSVTFTSSQAGKVVTANYKYAVDSYYILKPKSECYLAIRTSEVQFSSDVVVSSPLVFEVGVNIPNVGYSPILSTRVTYKNEKDFMIACNGGTGTIKPWGNFNKEVLVLPFEYARPKKLLSSQYVELRVYCEDHTPLQGTWATATFYVITGAEA